MDGLMRLGKKPPRHDARTLRFENYLRELPPAPAAVHWEQDVPGWGMMLNDRIGDCTIAAAGHMIEAWTANAQGQPAVVPDGSIEAVYSTLSGYNPETGQNDDGCVVLDVLNYWRKSGIGGHKIEAYVQVDPHNPDHVRAATWLFGGLYLGVQLPLSSQGWGYWRVPPTGPSGNGARGSWGGHAVPALGDDGDGLYVVTWGGVLRMTRAFLRTYCDEAYAILSPDWLARNQAPSGFDHAALLSDLKQVAS